MVVAHEPPDAYEHEFVRRLIVKSRPFVPLVRESERSVFQYAGGTS